jgi:hypothetical protein
MLFPNHPAYAEIRAGMGDLGYQPGAHALLGYTAPAHDLGDFSASMENAALDSNAGVTVNDIELLNSLGATDQDLTNLINGNITLTALYAQYGVTIPGGGGVVPTTSMSTPVTPASASITPTPSAPQGQLPTGSQFSYTGGWSPIHGSVGDVQAALSSKLPGSGMQLVAFNSTGSSLLGVGTAGFTATIAVTGVGFALLSDAQSIVVTIVQSVIGTGNLTTNQASVISTPNTPAADVTAAAASPIAWLENNAIYIGLAVGALVLVNNFTGKRR